MDLLSDSHTQKCLGRQSDLSVCQKHRDQIAFHAKKRSDMACQSADSICRMKHSSNGSSYLIDERIKLLSLNLELFKLGTNLNLGQISGTKSVLQPFIFNDELIIIIIILLLYLHI